MAASIHSYFNQLFDRLGKLSPSDQVAVEAGMLRKIRAQEAKNSEPALEEKRETESLQMHLQRQNDEAHLTRTLELAEKGGQDGS